jgi:hypothetical protein
MGQQQRRPLWRTGYSLLYRRQGIYRYRRQVPKHLREIIGRREIKISLRTTDLETAKRRLTVEALKTDRLFDEARRTLANPAALAFNAVRQDAADRRQRPRTEDELDAESLALTDELEKAETQRPLDPVRARMLRAVLDAREKDPHALETGSEDNPTLSMLFDRWREERRPPQKTWEEWTTARKRFESVVGGDVVVRSITKAHVRGYKEALLRTPKRHGSGTKLSPASSRLGAGWLSRLRDRAQASRGYRSIPELRADAHGTRTRMWSKRFARHVRVICGVNDKSKAPMHSFRHAWATAARAVMPEEHRHAIGGWSGGGVGRTYGTSVPLSVLAESMAKVQYESI